MARIRTIKPSFWSDPDVVLLSFEARLLLVGLISFADDDGRFVANPTAIAGYVFPHDPLSLTRIKKWRDEIAKVGIIELYRVGALDYGAFPQWQKHQVINKHTNSAFPPPPSFVSQNGAHL